LSRASEASLSTSLPASAANTSASLRISVPLLEASFFPMCLALAASAVVTLVSNGVEQGTIIISTFEPLLSGLGVAASLVEVVAGTDRRETATDLESSRHVVGCWREWIVEEQGQSRTRIIRHNMLDMDMTSVASILRGESPDLVEPGSALG
jgi:hypothetical protein